MASAIQYLKSQISHEDALTRKINNSSGGTMVAGSLVNVGEIDGMVFEDIADGEDGVIVVRANKMYAPKATGQAWTDGQMLYIDRTNDVLTTADTGGIARGFAVGAAASGDTRGWCRFVGDSPYDKTPAA